MVTRRREQRDKTAESRCAAKRGHAQRQRTAAAASLRCGWVLRLSLVRRKHPNPCPRRPPSGEVQIRQFFRPKLNFSLPQPSHESNFVPGDESVFPGSRVRVCAGCPASATLVSRDMEGKYHVTTTHGGSSTGAGAAWGGFWGLLFGLLFFVPFAGLALGAGFGALFGHLGEKAIDKEFQEQVRDEVKPGTSALFMIIEKATPDRAIEALKQYGGKVIRTSLSEEDTAKLQDALTPKEPVTTSSQ
jgi:uncharacterized membrane protein